MSAPTKPEETKRRKTACGWWSCRVHSFAHRDAACPICKRPKSGPKEG